MAEMNDIRSKYPEGSFRRIFWEQQYEASKLKSHKQMRWHPALVKCDSGWDFGFTNNPVQVVFVENVKFMYFWLIA